MGQEMHERILQRRIEVFTQKQLDMIAEHGYLIHMVAQETTHTHGLLENFGHPEIECALHADPNLLGQLVRDLAERVKKGEIFAAGQEINDLIQNFPVRLIESPTGLRLIIPDQAGRLDRGKMAPAYAAQYEGVSEA